MFVLLIYNIGDDCPSFIRRFCYRKNSCQSCIDCSIHAYRLCAHCNKMIIDRFKEEFSKIIEIQTVVNEL